VAADPELRVAFGRLVAAYGGGALRIDIEDSGASLYVTGQFIELERPRRLRFTWSCSDWADPSVQSEVRVLLEDHGAGQTLMTIEHEQLPPEQADRHQRGWGAIAGQLAGTLSRRAGGP